MDEKARAHEMIMGLPFEDREAAVPDDPEFAAYVIKRRLANPGERFKQQHQQQQH
jgi:hypothetical protein